MAHPITEDITDAIGLLVREHKDPEASDEAKAQASARLSRALKRLEEDAFKRGYQARQDEILANLRRAAQDLNL
jgi:hypothetical protein